MKRRVLTYFVFGLVATAASANMPFVMDGRLLQASKGGEVDALNLEVEPKHAFGLADGRPLFTVQHSAPPANTDLVAGEIDLWTTRDGEAFRLTSGELVMGASWSELENKVLYWTGEKMVHRVDLEGAAREELLSEAITPALSPDGRELAYVRVPADWAWNDHSKAFELRVLDLVSGKEREVLHGTDVHQPFWSPDGRFLLFLSSGEGVTSLWRVAAAGGEPAVQLTNHGLWTAKSPYFVENPSRNTDIRWSEDGSKLLYGASYSEAGEVMVIELDKTYEVVRAYQLTHGHSPRWGERDVVLVPRGEISGLEVATRSEAGIRLAEFPVDARFAQRVVEVATAPRYFEPPADLLEVPQTPPDKAIAGYRYPLHSSAGHPYTSFYDNNGGGGVRDWQCGGFTYNGHRGTDIGVAGWWVYAGAHGSLWSWNDGCPTIGYIGSSCGGGFGNYIKLSHGNTQGRNWYTTYAHFRNGTVVPSYHSCGNRVGISGSSGNSSGYHLHFQVDAYGHPNDDPFSGSCSGPVSYWCNQNGGYPTSSCC